MCWISSWGPANERSTTTITLLWKRQIHTSIKDLFFKSKNSYLLCQEHGWNQDFRRGKVEFYITKLLKLVPRYILIYIYIKFGGGYCPALGLSTGRAGSVLDPTYTWLASVRWRVEEPKTNCQKNPSSWFQVRVSVELSVGSVGC